MSGWRDWILRHCSLRSVGKSGLSEQIRISPAEVKKAIVDILTIFLKIVKKRGKRRPAFSRVTGSLGKGLDAAWHFFWNLPEVDLFQCITHIWGLNNQSKAGEKAWAMEAGLIEKLQDHSEDRAHLRHHVVMAPACACGFVNFCHPCYVLKSQVFCLQ